MNNRPYILGVDDEKYNRLIIEDVLEEDDFEVSCVANGQECLDSVKCRKPDLILLDVLMPVMDGLEVCRRLKANIETKSICILFLSALAMKNNIQAGIEAGGDGYLTKPIDPCQLLKTVKQNIGLQLRTT